jgi:hypothetical protein
MASASETRIAHHIPGRLRLRIPSLKNDPELAERLRRQLEQLEDVVAVDVRPISGSVVLQYQPNGRGPQGFVEALASLLPVEETPAARLPGLPSGESAGSLTADWMQREWLEANWGLKRASAGLLDIRTVVPFFFFFLGIRQLLVQPALDPIPWYVCFYYFFETFRHYYGRPTRRA